ncbi:hypothetical protein [Methanobrevibacter sp.]|uniref:hypothetical protein n=1 Tax=Methanobrevibacter sp. TaxID=66852 RepID=UPI0025FEA44B|nr:hypothetical protein [Methanobrevibacter sp.]MBQ2831204.1 hypothetical protein [Methanobrevibacter sp.]
MSLSVFSFLAQNSMITNGRIEANISEISSKTMNLFKSNAPFSKESAKHIIRNSGIVIIGGFVIVDIALAIFTLSMLLCMVHLN